MLKWLSLDVWIKLKILLKLISPVYIDFLNVASKQM